MATVTRYRISPSETLHFGTICTFTKEIREFTIENCCCKTELVFAISLTQFLPESEDANKEELVSDTKDKKKAAKDKKQRDKKLPKEKDGKKSSK